MNRKLKKLLLNVFILLACSIVVIMLFVNRDADDLIEILPTLNVKVLLFTILFFLLYFVFDALSYYIMGKKYRQDYHYRESLTVSFVGFFFSAITPSATGGQVGQIFILKKQHIPVTKGASLLVLQWVARQIAIVFYGIITLLLRYALDLTDVKEVTILGTQFNFLVLVLIGFLVHAGITVGILSLSISRKAETIISGIFKLLRKLKIIKESRYNEWNDKIKVKLDIYRAELKNVRENSKFMVLSFLSSIVSLTILFIIPYFVRIILNLPITPINVIESIVYGCFIFLISSYIPIPGASGGTELIFMAMLTTYYTNPANATSALLIWRFITFYFGLVLGLIVTVGFSNKKRVKVIEESMETEESVHNEVKEEYSEVHEENQNDLSK